jgi:hypothetical protein
VCSSDLKNPLILKVKNKVFNDKIGIENLALFLKESNKPGLGKDLSLLNDSLSSFKESFNVLPSPSNIAPQYSQILVLVVLSPPHLLHLIIFDIIS